MKIAITGGIAEGKSTVLGYLRDLGQPVQSADEIARAVFEMPVVQREIAEAAHLAVPIDRDQLRAAIALDAEIRRSVNRITHPRILNAIKASKARFFEVPLLLEACLQGTFDEVWLVTTGPVEQKRRLDERYGSDAVSKTLLATQLPTRAKTPFSARIFRTNQSPEAVRRLLSEAVNALLDG